MHHYIIVSHHQSLAFIESQFILRLPLNLEISLHPMFCLCPLWIDVSILFQVSNLYRWCVNGSKKKSSCICIKRPELCEVLVATFWGLVENQKGNHSGFFQEGSDGRIDTHSTQYFPRDQPVRPWYEIKTIYGRKNVEKIG